MDLVIEIHTRNVSFERWRELYHSDELNQLVMRQAHLRERTLLEHVPLDDGRERRKVRVVPDVEVPRFARGLLRGHEVAYTETTVFDPKTRTARLDIDTEVTDAVRIGGDVRYFDNDGGVRMRFEGQVTVDVFGIGGLVERFIAGEVRKRYAVVQRLMQELVGGA
jgi:hypothetical protein